MPEGILCIVKPKGFTSCDAVAKVRGITHFKKIGHGGTLDPMATGVLPLFFGRAAKATELMPVQDKRYTAEFRFGLTTDTQDITGKVLSETETHVTRAELEAVLPSFRGTVEQLPPMYSAVWVDGHRLYKLARQGKEVERPTREITIYFLNLLEFDEQKQTAVIDVRCSKGTYIRTLCHDIGQALGCGAALTSLHRTETLGFSIGECMTIDQLQEYADNGGDIQQKLMPVSEAFRDCPKLYLSPEQAKMFFSGVILDTDRIRRIQGEGLYRVYFNEHFLALARADLAAGDLIPLKFFTLWEDVEPELRGIKSRKAKEKEAELASRTAEGQPE